MGDFSSLGNNQSIELKLVPQDFRNNPQLVQLNFPEDITNVVDRVDILNATFTYEVAPEIEITAPTLYSEGRYHVSNNSYHHKQ